MERAYQDRRQAGRALSRKLSRYADKPEVIVLGLPRGGVPVAYEVARALHVPLDVFLVRKLGRPGHEEFVMGAIASGGVQVLNRAITRHVSPEALDHEIAKQRAELERREQAYRGNRPPRLLEGHTVIVVDDGLATGASMRAVIQALRRHAPLRIVVAVPIGSPETCSALAKISEETVCASTREPFRSVGEWYEDFTQTDDDEVRELLARAAHELAERAEPPDRRSDGQRKEHAHGSAR